MRAVYRAGFNNGGAGWLTTKGGYALSHLVGGGIASFAIASFLLFRNNIVLQQDTKST